MTEGERFDLAASDQALAGMAIRLPDGRGYLIRPEGLEIDARATDADRLVEGMELGGFFTLGSGPPLMIEPPPGGPRWNDTTTPSPRR